jgi:Rnl2 family RNA ligase
MSKRDATKPKSNQPKGVDEVIFAVSICATGRAPANGSLLSLGCTAITPQREVLGTLLVNLMPDPLQALPAPPDVTAFLRGTSRRHVLELMLRRRVPPAVGMQQLAAFCKGFVGKGTGTVLVASPMMSVYLWLAHNWAVAMPGQGMPWGFSGTCARSFAAGVLGVSMKELGSKSVFKASHEGYDGTGYPLTESIGTAAMYTFMLAHSKGTPPPPLTWAPSVAVVPTQLPSTVAPQLIASDATPLPFGEYPSITDPSFDSLCHEQFQAAAAGLEWVATEKVHGANLVVLSDGKDVFRCAKRTGLLTVADSEAFFQFAQVVSLAEEQIQRAVRSVLAAHPEACLVSIVGELAGGEYLHPAVPADLRGTRVQNGVQYAPYNFFYAFDIAVMPNGESGPEAWRYLPYDESQVVFEKAGLLHAKPLCRGSFNDVMAFSEEFASTVPGLLGLPPLANNFAEGLVVRPAAQEVLLASPLAPSEPRRVIIKKKHPKFREFAKTPAPAPAGRDPASALLTLVCANRLASVASKCMHAELADPKAVAALLVADARSDLLKMLPDAAGLEPQAVQAAQICAEELVVSAEGRAVLAGRGLSAPAKAES